MSSQSTTPASRTKTSDPVVTWFVYGIAAVIVLILSLALWVLLTGIMNPPTPRSYHEKQLDLLEQVVKQKPKVATAWADWARALIAAKQYSQAQRVLDRGDKALGKKTPELDLERARLELARGKKDSALKMLDETLKLAQQIRADELGKLSEKAVVIDPRTIKGDVIANAADLKGDLLAEKAQWAEAEKAYSTAVYEKPQSADYLVQRGAVYIELKEFDKAKKDFEQALAFIPDFQPALTGLERVEKESSK